MKTDKYQIRFLSIAEEDFSEIISYIAADNHKAAVKLADNIENNLELLSLNPKLGRIPRESEIRKLGYRYLIVQNNLIFYTTDNKSVLIHRILHGAKNYKSLL